MLNRRILRAKVMQAVFGALQTRNALQEVAREGIASHFDEQAWAERSKYTAVKRAPVINAALDFFDRFVAAKGSLRDEPLPDTFDAHTQAVLSAALLRLIDYSKLEVAKLRRELESNLQADSFNPEAELALQAEAVRLFDALMLNDEVTAIPERVDDRIRVAVAEALAYVTKGFQEHVKFARREMIKSCEELYVHYLTFMKLVLDTALFVEQDETEKQNRLMKPEPRKSWEFKLATNPIVLAIKNSMDFHEACIRNNVEPFDVSAVRVLFNEIVMPDEQYQAYATAYPEAVDFEAHKTFFRHLATRLVLKSDAINSWFEDRDFYWADNRDILKNMVVKTVKHFEDENTPLKLSQLSADWPDDKAFSEKLFDVSITHYQEYQKMLGTQSDNWDASRFSHTDMVIMVMTLAEIIHFSQIPVKVSINEFLEVAKLYSTPQSSQFINGLVDNVTEKLKADGVFKKTGRGII